MFIKVSKVNKARLVNKASKASLKPKKIKKYNLKHPSREILLILIILKMNLVLMLKKSIMKQILNSNKMLMSIKKEKMEKSFRQEFKENNKNNNRNR